MQIRNRDQNQRQSKWQGVRKIFIFEKQNKKKNRGNSLRVFRSVCEAKVKKKTTNLFSF